ncbi:MAG: hypothetical protein AAF456_22990 [Planctomycetota bacterium]
MSYGNSEGTGGPGKAAGGSGCVFLIVLLVGGYLLLSGMGGQIQPQPDENGNAQIPADIFDGDLPEQGQVNEPPVERHADADDWSMSDAGSTGDAQPQTQASDSGTTRTENGDWAIEEVGQTPDDQVEIRLNNDSEEGASRAEGDWEMEEVEGVGGSNSTRNGDWELEEVEGSGGG